MSGLTAYPDAAFSDSLPILPNPAAVLPSLAPPPKSVRFAASPPLTHVASMPSTTGVLVHALRYAEGRQKLAMLAQYVAKLAQDVVPEPWQAPVVALSQSMSDARKGLRYFKFWEEWQKLMWILRYENQALVRRLAVVSKIFAIGFLVLDNLLWVVQLRFVELNNLHFRRLKFAKNLTSILRYLFELPVQTVRKLRKTAKAANTTIPSYVLSHGLPAGLLLKYVELLCNMALASNGLLRKPQRMETRTVGLLGTTSAVIACQRLWDATRVELREQARLSSSVAQVREHRRRVEGGFGRGAEGGGEEEAVGGD